VTWEPEELLPLDRPLPGDAEPLAAPPPPPDRVSFDHAELEVPDSDRSGKS
jgi:hypothetical protein